MRIQKMIGTLSREVESLGVEVIGTEFSDERHGVIITDRPPKNGALKLSATLPGMIFIGGSHISWVSGSYAVAIHTAETWEKLQPIRATAQAITGELGRYGIGACARQLAAWLGKPEPGNPRLREYTGDWHYQKCTPGIMDHAYQFDLSACYFNLLRRVPSLTPSFSSNEVFWRSTASQDAERFRRLIDGVAGTKPLRNALVGAFFGGSSQIYLHKGKTQRFRTAPGGKMALAALIVRTAYEVCQLQADISGAVYANTDSVICSENTAGFWADLGLPFTLGASGPANVQAIGKYKVGLKETKTFTQDKTGTLRSARESRRVDPVYWRWLTSESPLLK